MTNLFVTGTDTEIGKTTIAAAMVHSLRQCGLPAVGMKPVASGCRETAQGLRNDDAETLIAASGQDLPYEKVNPYAFAPAIAPHIAAAAAGVSIERDVILRAYRDLEAAGHVIVVEGVGGFRVPLGEFDTADLAQALALPVVLVVGPRLGCINHALLTVEAIAARGLALAGWVANACSTDMAVAAENVVTLRGGIDAPLLGHVPRLPQPGAAAVARFLDLSPVR